MANYRNRKLLDLAEGKACSNCGKEDGTVVAAHSNLGVHGRGYAHQAHDCYVAFLCWNCHHWLDAVGVKKDPTGIYEPTKQDKEQMFRRAMDKTWLHIWANELAKVA